MNGACGAVCACGSAGLPTVSSQAHLVLLHGGDHGLAGGADGPQAHQALPAPAHHMPAVAQALDGCDPLVVRIMDSEQQLAALGPKGPDLAIAPPTENAAAILRTATS